MVAQNAPAPGSKAATCALVVHSFCTENPVFLKFVLGEKGTAALLTLVGKNLNREIKYIYIYNDCERLPWTRIICSLPVH